MSPPSRDAAPHLPLSEANGWLSRLLVRHEEAPAKPRTVARPRSRYIVAPAYDWAFFILSPLIALALGVLVVYSPTLITPLPQLLQRGIAYGGSIADLFMGAFIMAHLVIVFFRSHGNPAIFRLYPMRFTVVPALLLAVMMSSTWAIVVVSVLATWWDVYHSGLQTFGLGRIYDSRVGNDPKVGRRLDIILNHLIYAGPILAGVTLMDHVDDFDEFAAVGSGFFTAIPALVESYAAWLTWAVLAFGVPFIAYYLYCYRRYRKQGYQVSTQKVVLLSCTAAVSIFTWSFNTFGTAFLIMNFFHALQYFAIVWAMEKRGMQSLFRLDGLRIGRALTLGMFVGLAFGYGLWVEAVPSSRTYLPVILVISIMHFWYDGFVWSVRRKQV